MKAVGYARVSTSYQVDDGYGLSDQRERIKAYCTFRGLELVELIEDPAVSGTSTFAERPGGRRVIELVEARGVEHVVGTKLDRLFRGTVDCLTTIDRLNQHDVELHLIDFGGSSLNTSKPAGKMLLSIMAVVAQWEAETIAERVVAGLAERKRQGLPLGTAPYGWRYEEGVLHQDENEQGVIRTIERLRAMRLSAAKMAAWLNERGVPSRRGKWHRTSIERILRREFKTARPKSRKEK